MKIINQKNKMKNRVKDMMYLKTWRRFFIRFSIYMVLLTVAVLIALVPNLVDNVSDIIVISPHKIHKPHVRYSTDLKYILFWKHQRKTKRHLITKNPDYQTGQSEFIKQKCPHFNCYITYNRSFFENEDDYDAIVLSLHDLKHLNTFNMDLGRSPHQVYIFQSLQPAEDNPICDPHFNDFFNWTWTYRLDSDIAQPLISIRDKRSKMKVGPRNSMEWQKDVQQTDNGKLKTLSKSKAVAWLVTNCKLKNKYRIFIEELRTELKNYNYTLDIFGPCGNNKCTKRNLGQCYQQIEKNYFFILVTEDALAEDYVTEKIATAMSYYSVPVVYGGANYSNFLPPGSYINAREFGLKKLSAVLDYLIRNPDKYSFFFDWKQYYYYTTVARNSVCDLCAKLNQQNNTWKTWYGIRKWWNPDFDEICQRNNLYELFNEKRDT